MSRASVPLKGIEHQVTYREGFYGSLALSVVLLVLSGIGVRHAVARGASDEPPAVDAAPAKRPFALTPFALTLFGILNILVGTLLTVLMALDLFSPEGFRGMFPESVQGEPLFRAWMAVAPPLQYLASNVLIVAGIGLLLVKRWGRTASLGVSVFKIGMFVIELPLYMMFLIAPSVSEMNATGSEDAAGLLMGLAIALPVIVCFELFFPILLLVAMQRPNVKGAFGSQIRPQAPGQGAAAVPAIPPSGALARAWHEWWSERDRWFTRAVQTVLILLHFVCLFTFLSFGFSSRDVAGQRAVSVRIGIPSPWFTYDTYPEPNVPFRWNIDLFSSSLLVAAIGLLAFYVYWRIEKTKADFKVSYWNSPKPMLIVWALLAVAAIVMMLSIASIVGRPKSETPDSTRPKTGEQWSGNEGQELVMYWGPDSPTVSDRLARHLGLDAAQREAMNQAFQMFFREFKALEDQNTRHETDANGHQITTIAPLLQQVPPLAERFWSELESVLDGRQLTLGRKVVSLREGTFLSGRFGYRVEIWRVGQINPWYHWKVSNPGIKRIPVPGSVDHPSSAAVLPESLRRFWKEPAASGTP